MAKRTRMFSTEGNPEQLDREGRVERPSRGEQKRLAERLAHLGMKLVELKPAVLTGLPLDDELREAIDICQSLKRGNARARQSRLIGKLLRDRETDALFEAVELLSGGGQGS